MNNPTDLTCPLCSCPLPMGLEAGDATSCPDCGEPLVVDWSNRRTGLEAYRDPDSVDDAMLKMSGGLRGSDAVDEMRNRMEAARQAGRTW